MPFQSKVNSQQAPGVAGDFASTNPFASVLAGQGELVAPAGGLVVGNFAWVGPAGQVSQSYVAGYQIGFLGRNEQALITQFLGEYTMVVPAGFMITLFNEGDFYAKFPAGATPGQNVYADPNTGTPISSASTPSAASATASEGATGTLTTVSGSATVTVNTVSAGLLAVGDTVVSANVPTGTTVLSQATVTSGSGAGILGTYVLSAAATASAGPTAFTTNSTLLNVTAVASGSLNVGDVFSGTGVTAGTTIVSQAAQFAGVATLASSTTLTVTSVVSGSGKLRVGDTVVGTGIPANTTISSQTSGTPGGVGVYVMSAAATVSNAGVAVTDANIPGQRGRYVVNDSQNFASTTITVAGTAQATGFKVRGIYTAGDNEVVKISTN
jgi:hypothetical protein